MIREFGEDDLPEIVRFGLEASRPVLASFEEHYGPDVLSSYCTNEDDETWVSETSGGLSGFVVLWSNEGTGLGQIGLVAVHPDFQNHGVGTQLNEPAVARPTDAGMAWVIVGTGDDPGHAPALGIQPHQLAKEL